MKFLAEQANEKMESNQRSLKYFLIILKESFGEKKQIENQVSCIEEKS